MDMAELMKKPLQIYQGFRVIKSGSHREGFRFQSSDIDKMLWYTKHKVI